MGSGSKPKPGAGLRAILLIYERILTPTHFWTPSQGIVERSKKDRVCYDAWHRDGHLRATPGATVDYEYVAHDIATILDGLNVQAIAYDRWRIDLLKK
jgi:phage terminase large subunit-like protein